MKRRDHWGSVLGRCHRVRTGSGAQPPSYPRGTAGSYPGIKRPGREADII